MAGNAEKLKGENKRNKRGRVSGGKGRVRLLSNDSKVLASLLLTVGDLVID